MGHARHVRRSEVELRPVAGEERRVPPAFFLRQHIGLSLELRVRRDAARLRDYLPPLDVLALHSSEQQPYVVSRHSFIKQLLEHLHPRHYRLERRPDAHYFHRLVDLHLAPLYSARGHRPPPLDRKDVFDRHQKRLLDVARRSRNVAVHGFHQLQYLLLGLLIAVQRLQRRHLDDGYFIARKFVLAQQLSDFQLHQLEQLGICRGHRINLIQTHHHGQQNVFPGLGHRPISSGYH